MFWSYHGPGRLDQNRTIRGRPRDIVSRLGSSKWLLPIKQLESNVFSFFNSFSISKCFDLLEVIFLLRLDSLASKSVFAIKFACANLALKASAAKVLNSGVVIHLSWLWSVSFFSSSLIFVLQSVLLTKLLTLGILFLTAVNADFVAKLVRSGVLFSN